MISVRAFLNLVFSRFRGHAMLVRIPCLQIVSVLVCFAWLSVERHVAWKNVTERRNFGTRLPNLFAPTIGGRHTLSISINRDYC